MERKIKPLSKILVLSLAFIIVGAVAYEIGQRNAVTLNSVVEVQGQPIHGRVRYWVNRGAGWIEVDVNNNLVVTQGLTLIRDYLRANTDQTSWNNVTAISLSTDATSPSAAWTVIPTEITTGGLERIYASNVNNVNTTCYNCTHIFTASATHTSVQLSGLNWDNVASNNTLFAANQFTATTLYSSDQLNDMNTRHVELKIEELSQVDSSVRWLINLQSG